MRLTTIKLSGFKSFVDPTTLQLPSNLTVVVGPNGCGKSNIIDAVRWVMGESAASRLRGEALTDVIFSGAAGRKPVSQASVELCFDNSCGTIGGEYAAFNEIAVRRTVNRDGSSAYFLNGSRCRKRDITELFLGTGLGPRSYAIIEQGMISQVIDAKPDELRVHLEEAAGISLYKERRRETLSRIGQTRENLERLDDLRGEIGRQLGHLKQQAEQASSYRQLQAQREHAQARLLGVQLQAAQTRRDSLAEALATQQGQLEQAESQAQADQQARQAVAGELQQAQQALEHAQAWLYTRQAEHTRLEQALAHAQALIARQQHDQAQADAGLQALDRQLEQDRLAAAQLEQAQQALAPLLEQARAALQQAGQVQAQADAAHADWQQQWEQGARADNAANSALARERTRSEFVARQQAQLQQRQQAVEQALAALQAQDNDQALARCRSGLDASSGQLQAAQQAAVQAEAQHAALEQQLQQAHEQVQQLRARSQVLGGQVAAMQTLQAAALGHDDTALQDWLAAHALETAPRLGSVLEVADGWEAAVEICLGPWLEAVVVPPGQLPALQARLPAGQRVLLIDGADGGLELAAHSLARQVRGPLAARRLLAQVSTGEEVLDEAGAGAQVHWQVSRAGVLHGPGCSRVGSTARQQGVVLREQQLRVQEGELAAVTQALALAQQAEAAVRAQLAAARQQQTQAQAALGQARHAHAGAQAALTLAEGQQQARLRSHDQSLQEQHALATQQASLDEEAAAIAQALALAEQQAVDCAGRRDALEQHRQPLRDAASLARRALSDARDQLQARVLESQTLAARQQAVAQALQRGQQQRLALSERLQALGEGQQRDAGSVDALQAEREAAVFAQLQAAAQLAQARTHWQALQARSEQVLQQGRQRLAWRDAQREALVEKRLALQAADLALEHLHAQIAEAGLVPDAVLALAADGQAVEALQRELQQLDVRLRRMEPVNLAAIDEYAAAGERAAWLDSQHADLSAALETLETAMARIDRETRSRFKETYDKVNAGLQALYPRLFGGGHAQLELTDADLLEAGVVLMARPPGKKISSLSLLSGGEKAMTAVALVFAIFQLNPAPFCLLDEVDAPLDESNVGRLADMLREMSASVQFLSVSHNKATMEAAEQLCGVTMREPGVSRLVSVDLTEATRLAGAA